VIQRQDGSFTETMGMNDALRLFGEMVDAGEAPKAMFCRTSDELEKIKAQKGKEQEVADLKSRVDELEWLLRPSRIARPSVEEIAKFSNPVLAQNMEV